MTKPKHIVILSANHGKSSLTNCRYLVVNSDFCKGAVVPKTQGNESNAPIFKDRKGGLSVSAWQFSAVLQKRKPKTSDPNGEWFTEVEVKPLNKEQCEFLGKAFTAAAKVMSVKDFSKGKPKAKATDDDEDEAA